MLALYLMLLHTYYANNYVSIIDATLTEMETLNIASTVAKLP